MTRPDRAATMPSEISPTLTMFDRFATVVEGFGSRACEDVRELRAAVGLESRESA